jgi:hypothetical protein
MRADEAPTSDERQLVLRFEPEAGSDLDEVERGAGQLRAEMLATDIDTMIPVAIGAPVPGAKGVDPVTVSEWVVTLSASGGVLATLIATAKAWVERSGRAHRIVVTMDGDTIELERAAPGEREKLLTAFVERHRTG